MSGVQHTMNVPGPESGYQHEAQASELEPVSLRVHSLALRARMANGRAE